MSDDDDTLTPEQEREVRRLLAEARHDEPIPEDVAARLDRVVAELARGESGDPTPVTALASRRRQRVVSLLVAAAAVVVVGIGLGQVLGTRGGDEGSVAGADRAGSPSAESPLPKDDAAEGLTTDSGGAARTPQGSTPDALRYALRSPAVVDPDRFSHDLLRLRRRAAMSVNAPDASSSATAGELDSLAGFSQRCPPADWGAGIFVPVLYAGDPAVLVFRRAVGDTQVVDLFQCGDPDVVRSITLPAP